MVDKLEQILEMQSGLMKRLGVVTYTDDPVKAQTELRDMLFAICCELGETADEINWKPWKKTKKQVDMKLLQTELIDILHFTLEMLIICDMDAQMIFEVYQAKMAENHARQNRGY